MAGVPRHQGLTAVSLVLEVRQPPWLRSGCVDIRFYTAESFRKLQNPDVINKHMNLLFIYGSRKFEINLISNTVILISFSIICF